MNNFPLFQQLQKEVENNNEEVDIHTLATKINALDEENSGMIYVIIKLYVIKENGVSSSSISHLPFGAKINNGNFEINPHVLPAKLLRMLSSFIKHIPKP